MNRNKAVSDGAIVNSLHRTVRTRVAKYSYGVRSIMKFDPLNPEHPKRSHKCVAFMNGTRGLTGHFGMLLQKANPLIQLSGPNLMYGKTGNTGV